MEMIISKKKIEHFLRYFNENHNINVIQDKPFITEEKNTSLKKIISFQFGQVFTLQAQLQLGSIFL